MTEHFDSVKTYAGVWIILLGLTGLTTAVAYVDLVAFSVVVALLIAVVKMLLVALFFMHLKFETALMRWLLVVSVVACFIIMYFFFFPDADRIINLGVQ